jgi:60 kDa SS-A/Ro ribonucleoprotein
MANKTIFSGNNRGVTPVAYNAVNEAGGRAYSRSDEEVVAQYVVTGCLNQTFYASADEQVDTIMEKSKGCSDKFLAQAAVYARKTAKMKDTPTLLAAILATRGEEALELLELVFPRVVDNQKQLRNFVQIIRSGKVGRKSLGTALKRMVNNWLNSQSGDQLFYQSVGNDPSLADIVKMTHPKPSNKETEAFFGWLLVRKYNKRYLPKLLKAFEAYKADPVNTEVPAVDFRMLTALELGTPEWTAIALNASWNTLRMNLNTFERHGVLKDKGVVRELATKLADKGAVRKYNVFPYQLLTTFQAVQGTVPVELSNALQDAMEYATENVPELNGTVAVCVDTSASMQSPVTGHRAGSTTKTSCVDVAGLVAASVLRKNPSAIIVPFDTAVRSVNLNPRDSVMTNARKLALHGGGTDCSIALAHLLVHKMQADTVIYVSDNESWYKNAPVTNGDVSWVAGGGRATAMATAWARYKAEKANRKSKLVCIDIQPYATVQVPDNKDVLNIGGFTDSVFGVVANFVNGDSRDFVKTIKDAVEL